MIVRFLQDSRHGDWRKGQKAEVIKTLALAPQNQFDLYILEIDPDSWFSDASYNAQVWATSKDIEPWNQLSLF